MSMVACSKDDVGGANVPENKGDMFMSMVISPSGAVGTRTATPDQGKEVGKDRENKISNALIIFAKEASEGNYTVVTSIYAGTVPDSEILPSVSGDQVMANFKVDRNTILKAISGTETPATEGEKKFYLFVVANAPSALAGKFTAGVDVQQEFATTGDLNTYWTVDNFLMSNAELYEKTIKAVDIQPGLHTESTNAYSLNEDEKPVKIQRAMSRFDLATNSQFTTFTATAEEREDEGTANSDIKNIKLEFDAVALINMASSANTFKVTAANADAVANKTILFGTETATNWVVSPTQTQFWTPLFGTGAATSGKMTGDSKGLESFFVTAAPEATTNAAVGRVGGYTLIEKITEADNDYVRPNGAPSELPAYNIWRYCMENTNPYDKNGQVNGNSTGVVFRAKMTGKKVDGEDLDGETDGPIYAYGNVILGNAEALWTYATSPKDEDDESNVYAAVKLKYDVIIQKHLDANKNDASGDEWDFDNDGYKSTNEGTDWFETKATDFATTGKYVVHHGNLDDLKAELVESGFTVYTPDGDNNYYCYYIYWNRHNDNGNNSTMGEMEFATVRNNVYKLRVSKIHKLGHPGKSEDDPDDPTPDTPDETDSFYCEIICEILPWEVRINDIEF